MITLDATFSDRFIVKGLNANTAFQFAKLFLEEAWTQRKVPEDLRKAKGPKTLTLEMLPAAFSIEEAANKLMKTGVLRQERVGTVWYNVDMKMMPAVGVNSQIRVEVNKFQYEKDGDDLHSTIVTALRRMDVEVKSRKLELGPPVGGKA